MTPSSQPGRRWRTTAGSTARLGEVDKRAARGDRAGARARRSAGSRPPRTPAGAAGAGAVVGPGLRASQGARRAGASTSRVAPGDKRRWQRCCGRVAGAVGGRDARAASRARRRSWCGLAEELGDPALRIQAHEHRASRPRRAGGNRAPGRTPCSSARGGSPTSSANPR